MSKKEEIKKEVAKIAETSKNANDDVLNYVKNEYAEALKSETATKEDVKKLTKATLEGVKEGLETAKTSGVESNINEEELKKKIAEYMVLLAKIEAQKTLETTKELAEKTKEKLGEVAHKASDSFDDVDDKLKDQMKVALEKLKEAKEKSSEKLAAIGEALKEYADEKKDVWSEELSETMHKTAEKTKETVAELMEEAKTHTKQITSHSLKKMADWLKKMSEKIES